MFNFIKNKLSKKINKEIIIVSGLPRSGTSMMMKMLEAGGLEVLTDHIRKPDENNLNGYYEFEKVKKIKEDKSWLDDCEGKAVKMVSALLYHLPADKKYKIVFMQRNMNEILASQKRMLDNFGRDEGSQSDSEMEENFNKHLDAVIKWLGSKHNIKVFYINYNKMIDSPKTNLELLNSFFDNQLQVDTMAKVVDSKLYRQQNEDKYSGHFGR